MKNFLNFSGFIALILAIIVLSGCNSTKSAPDPYANSIRPSITGTWKLVTMSDGTTTYHVFNKITLQIPEDPPHSINGNTGINLYNGTAWIKSEDFECGPLAVTKMTGTAEETENESNYLHLLRLCNKIKIEDNSSLCIYNKENGAKLDFIKLD